MPLVPPTHGQGTSFASRGFPKEYPNTNQETWNISGPAGHWLQFDAEYFDTELGYEMLTFTDVGDGVTLPHFFGDFGPRSYLTSNLVVRAHLHKLRT